MIWLAELRDHTAGPDGTPRHWGSWPDSSKTKDRVIVVTTTMWPGYWDSYLDASRTPSSYEHVPARSGP
jgi:hypothetical protein